MTFKLMTWMSTTKMTSFKTNLCTKMQLEVKFLRCNKRLIAQMVRIRTLP